MLAKPESCLKAAGEAWKLLAKLLVKLTEAKRNLAKLVAKAHVRKKYCRQASIAKATEEPPSATVLPDGRGIRFRSF